MTNAADTDLRPILEGTLADFPIAELLALLAATKQTGTLQVAVTPAALLTVVDGRVAFASTDAGYTVRDLLLDAGAVTTELWQRTVSAGIDVATLGEALVDAGADRDGLQQAIRDQIVRVCESLIDQPGGRFRFVRQSRSSMGEAFTCTADLLREKLVARASEWDRLRIVVPSDRSEIVVRPALAQDCEQVEIARADWPVLLAVGTPTTPAALDGSLGLGIFATTQSLVRLWEAGTIVVDGRALPSAADDDATGESDGADSGASIAAIEPDDPFAASTVSAEPQDATRDEIDGLTDDELDDDGPAVDEGADDRQAVAEVAGPSDGFEDLRAAFSGF